ncbi:hopanoid-associated sugar epimerase [Methylomonas sp. AM2-LC]|uniref:hopanoid-associated sugar epimerase n=1 Tax=Methylomonas sp. AM2-LC TaxID=3153301 RepID=UPI003267A715
MSNITFLTGSTGFIGAAVARLLIAKGHNLRVLTRANNDRRNIKGLDVEIIEGDLAKPESYSHALQDCNYLFHVAADYRIWVPDANAMHRVNVEGSRALMLAALDAGVERIVYTSSVATLGLHKNGTPATENTVSTVSDMVGIYKQSKFLAEAEVRKLITDEKLPAIIVNPSSPIGPRDIKPTPTGRIIVDSIKGRIPAYVDTGLNIVHVDDVANGHWLAFERGQIGQRYILGGENLSLCDILGIIAEIENRPAPRIKLPCKAILPLAFGMELAARLTGREPMISRDALSMAKNKMFFNSTKAELELGYSARPAREAIHDAINWFRAEGYCE